MDLVELILGNLEPLAVEFVDEALGADKHQEPNEKHGHVDQRAPAKCASYNFQSHGVRGLLDCNRS